MEKPSLPVNGGYCIGGIKVEFPYKPYGPQLAFMGRVISTLDRAKVNGRSHALLESPTGTGKTLSLLCSVLAWQKSCASKYANARPVASTDPLLHGGGFIPQPEPSRNMEQHNTRPMSARAQRKQIRPTIYYASRTHSQISQVIREYRKTSYRVPMAILASRKHYCTNKHVCMKENIDEECKLLLKDGGRGCLEYKNAQKLRAHPSLQKGGCHEVHDIEDLVQVGRMVKGCPYFAAQTMAAEADLVFCPYSYVINPVIRRAMDIDIEGAILVLDEAHNIEDMARDAGSLDVEEEVLSGLELELEQLSLVNSVASIYQPLHDMIQGITSWIRQKKNNLEKRDFEHYCTCWTGENALKELQETGISQQCFPVLKECAIKAIRASSEAETDGVHLTGISSLTLEGLVSSLCFLLTNNGHNAHDYQLALKHYVKRDAKNAGGTWTCSYSLWCLNPGVVFREIADLSFSVILSSGGGSDHKLWQFPRTLSPMGTFASELGIRFEACLEAPHVIDVESQLWAGVISKGPGNFKLNASYKTSDKYAFQDALGKSLEEICKIVPGGVLVFFPSYKLLEKLQNRWYQTGQWSRLDFQKSLFTEPRSKVDDFDIILKRYYASVHGNDRILPKKVKRGQKCDVEFCSESPSFRGGAAFLAVCRGKVSEGIDFSDDNARAVVIVGIPFPNINDIQVTLKKKYNDRYKSSKCLLSGNEWYCHQAFRALNQAAGRCIRHRFDYGAIILLDERFEDERNLAYVSRWIRKSIKRYDSFDSSLEELKAFFAGQVLHGQHVKIESQKIHGKNIPEAVLQVPKIKKENYCPRANTLRKCTLGQVIQKCCKVNDQQRGRENNSTNQKKDLSTELMIPDNNASLSLSLSQFDAEACDVHTKQSLANGECNMESCSKEQRWPRASLVLSDCNTDNLMSSKETVLEDLSANEFMSKDVDSHSTTLEVHNLISREAESDIFSLNNSNTIGEDTCTLSASTPKRLGQGAPTLEPESCLSVTSHHQKRKKIKNLNKICVAPMWSTNSHVSESCFHDPSCRNTTYKDLNPTEFSVGTSTGYEHQKISDATFCRKLHICCKICRNPLGLQKESFIVPCSLACSSKVYLAHVLKNGPTSNCTPDSVHRTKSTKISVAIAQILSVDQRLFNSHVLDGSSQGFWCEPDGCVFRIIYCPFCTDSITYLGLQIMATNSLNAQLMDKILFYVDRLHIKKDEGNEEVISLDPSLEDNIPNQSVVSFGSSSSAQQITNSSALNTIKSKLKLPKKEVISARPNS